MKDFDIVKYLKENNQGAYGMFNGYVDLKPLKEEEENTPAEETAEEEPETVPYEAEEDQLTGLGDTDSFEQDDIVSENYEEEEEYPDYTRIMDLGGEQIEQGIIKLLDDGFSEEDILELCKEFVEGQAQMKAADTRIDKLKQDIGYLGRGLEEESISENRLEGLIDRRDISVIRASAQRIFDDLTDAGFEAEDVAEYLIDQIRRAAVPYMQ